MKFAIIIGVLALVGVVIYLKRGNIAQAVGARPPPLPAPVNPAIANGAKPNYGQDIGADILYDAVLQQTGDRNAAKAAADAKHKENDTSFVGTVGKAGGDWAVKAFKSLF